MQDPTRCQTHNAKTTEGIDRISCYTSCRCRIPHLTRRAATQAFGHRPTPRPPETRRASGQHIVPTRSTAEHRLAPTLHPATSQRDLIGPHAVSDTSGQRRRKRDRNSQRQDGGKRDVAYAPATPTTPACARPTQELTLRTPPDTTLPAPESTRAADFAATPPTPTHPTHAYPDCATGHPRPRHFYPAPGVGLQGMIRRDAALHPTPNSHRDDDDLGETHRPGACNASQTSTRQNAPATDIDTPPHPALGWRRSELGGSQAPSH